MKNWDEFLALAERARQEPAPPVDVARRVMSAIDRERLPADQRTLVWCAIGSLAAAGIVALLASAAWSDLSDPLGGLLQNLEIRLQ